MSDVDEYRPTTARQRRRILLVTLLTVAALWSLLLFRPGAKVREFPPGPAASSTLPCPPGQNEGCVGGKADVLLLPANSAQPQAPSPPKAVSAK